MVGIKIFNIATNRVVRVVGGAEANERFLGVALYQGVPKVDTQFLLSKIGAEAAVSRTAEQMQAAPVADPTVFCTRYSFLDLFVDIFVC